MYLTASDLSWQSDSLGGHVQSLISWLRRQSPTDQRGKLEKFSSSRTSSRFDVWRSQQHMDHIWTTFGPRATPGQRFAVNRIRAPRWCQPIDLRLIESRAAGNGFQCHLQLREATHRRDNIVFLEGGREDTPCMCACTCKCWGWRISTRACVYVCKRERGSGNSEIEWRKKNNLMINMRMNYFIQW